MSEPQPVAPSPPSPRPTDERMLQFSVKTLGGILLCVATGAFAVGGFVIGLKQVSSEVAASLKIDPEFAERVRGARGADGRDGRDGRDVPGDARAVPVGTVIMLAANCDAPEGFVPCDGRSLDRAQYKELFSVVGVTWGDGEWANSFKVPDLRGVFPRFYGAGGNHDKDRRFGTLQEEGTKRPKIPFRTSAHVGKRPVQDSNNQGGTGGHKVGEFELAGELRNPEPEHTIEDGGDPETRPVNQALLGFIRAR